MRCFLPALLLMVGLDTLPACTVNHQPAGTPAASPSKKPGGETAAPSTPASAAEAAPSIIFSKTPCLGTCPHYTATIYPDGRVSYEGFRYAPVEGKREFRLSVSTVNTILARAREMRFGSLKKRYTDGASDLPSTSLSIRQAGGTPYAVSVESDGPAELTNLFQYVEKQITDGLGVTADR